MSVECPHCGYDWEPRTEQPKSCPVCKRYIVVPEKLRMKRLKSIKILEPEITGIYFDCTKCREKEAARFRFKKDLLCPNCVIEAVQELVPVEVPEET